MILNPVASIPRCPCVRAGNLCYYQTASKLDLQYRMLVVPLAIDVPNEVWRVWSAFFIFRLHGWTNCLNPIATEGWKCLLFVIPPISLVFVVRYATANWRHSPS